MIDNTDSVTLRNTYNPDGSNLRKLQLRMLEILKVVDEICMKHDIKYWLSSGTLLGAVRHGGFIPWDDDLDIEMLREDYLKFIKIVPLELPHYLILQTDETDPNYIYLSAKIRDLNSYIYDKLEVNRMLRHQGAFIDVFCLEPSLRWCRKLSVPLFNIFTWRFISKTGFKRNRYHILRKLLKKYIYPFFRLCSKFAPQDRLFHTFGVFFPLPRYKGEIFPLSKIEFEGSLFNAPHNCDSYLRRLYGEYEKLPKKIEPHIIDNIIEIY